MMGFAGIVFMIFAFIAAISLYRFVAVAKVLNNNKKDKRITVINTDGAGVRDLLLEGRTDEAIDVYAAFMGVDEFTSRDAINTMQRELSAESNLSDDNFDNIRNLIAKGKKIEAYKQYRKQTGASLEEAKRFIELEL